jgi:hypothetical protein
MGVDVSPTDVSQLAFNCCVLLHVTADAASGAAKTVSVVAIVIPRTSARLGKRMKVSEYKS